MKIATKKLQNIKLQITFPFELMILSQNQIPHHLKNYDNAK